MDAAQSSFISSTMWTERVGYVAALATLKKMERHNVPARLVELGQRTNAGWLRIAEEHGLPVHIDGIPPLTHIGFEHPEALAIQTLYTQEMLQRGYLLGAAVYMTWAYDEAIIDRFIRDSGETFAVMRDALDKGDLHARLAGGVIQAGFKRLT